MASVIKYGIIATLIIWVLSLVTCTNHIQKDLTQKTIKTLEDTGEQVFIAKASGRDLEVTLKDKTEDEQLKYEKIIQEKTYGIRKVTVGSAPLLSLEERGRNKLDEAGYNWARLNHADKILTVSGDTIDADAPKAITKSLEELEGVGEIVNNINVWEAYDLNACQNELNTLLQTHIIEFNVDSAKIAQNVENENLLYQLSVIMRRCPESKVEILGHTDNTGDEDYNISLSEKRAQATLEYLKQLAVHPERLSAMGFGSSQPLMENDTEENRQKNRRIEFKIKSVSEE